MVSDLSGGATDSSRQHTPEQARELMFAVSGSAKPGRSHAGDLIDPTRIATLTSVAAFGGEDARQPLPHERLVGKALP